MKDIYLGVPVKLGKSGIEEIIELQLNPAEKELLQGSSVAVRFKSGVASTRARL